MNRPASNRPIFTASRRGIFLIDLLLTISIAGVILATGVSLIVLLLRTDSTVQRHQQSIQQTSRLAGRFREDVHQATAAELLPEDDPHSLRLTLSDTVQITWEIQEHRLIRRRQAGEETSRDIFALAPETAASFTREGDLIRLFCEVRPSRSPRAANRDLILEALLNRENRWTISEEAPPAREEN